MDDRGNVRRPKVREVRATHPVRPPLEHHEEFCGTAEQRAGRGGNDRCPLCRIERLEARGRLLEAAERRAAWRCTSYEWALHMLSRHVRDEADGRAYCFTEQVLRRPDSNPALLKLLELPYRSPEWCEAFDRLIYTEGRGSK